MILRMILCLSALLLPAELPAAESSLCDQNLPQDSDSPVAYRMRGDRCEGIYAQQVSSISIEVRSLVAGFGPFDPAKDRELELAWTAPPGSTRDVRLRAFSFKPRTYFRMDTALPAVRGVYHWPAEVLASQKLGRDELGLLAWIDMPGPGSSTRQVYLPLRAGGGTAKAGAGYELALFPTARLTEVRVTVSRLDAQGKTVATLRSDEELGYDYYAAGEPTVFSTGKLGPAGFYHVEVTALLRNGSSVHQDLDLYHSGD